VLQRNATVIVNLLACVISGCSYHFVIALWSTKAAESRRVKRDWEIIADNLSKAGWSWGCLSAIDSQGRTIWIAQHRGDGKRFIVRADEKLAAFLELEAAVRAVGRQFRERDSDRAASQSGGGG
jgi:hypothetical protein